MNQGAATAADDRGARVLDESKPLYIAVAEQVEDGILDGTHPEGEPVPSTNELAAFLRINPATAGKGLNLLADAGVLVKHRGLGMFVAPGAVEAVRRQRQEAFTETYIVPLPREAAHRGIGPGELARMITKEASRCTPSSPIISASTTGTSPPSTTSPSPWRRGGSTACWAATAPARPP